LNIYHFYWKDNDTPRVFFPRSPTSLPHMNDLSSSLSLKLFPFIYVYFLIDPL
jgi:hypothetical protein